MADPGASQQTRRMHRDDDANRSFGSTNLDGAATKDRSKRTENWAAKDDVWGCPSATLTLSLPSQLPSSSSVSDTAAIPCVVATRSPPTTAAMPFTSFVDLLFCPYRISRIL
ncbi:uncharacterized protein SPSK_06762 [Sporothrix schenckii 1099-18]|uniref:Uncharacterized protein n=1 Tax=Sporothrix schenckii 1099-18 TaxID=1397361 RepID=A0A0F2MLC0_SPOSC|nr:uncharacterized protein SPSK_06762 [Sporothrix schenckii 1099-18]KJR89635.1 hypothetical protein SPSK_06762 [Sporothrix schenckii 1099-18]